MKLDSGHTFQNLCINELTFPCDIAPRAEHIQPFKNLNDRTTLPDNIRFVVEVETTPGEAGDPGRVAEQDESRDDGRDVIVNVPNDQLTVVTSRHQMTLQENRLSF